MRLSPGGGDFPGLLFNFSGFAVAMLLAEDAGEEDEGVELAGLKVEGEAELGLGLGVLELASEDLGVVDFVFGIEGS